jgi:hypothetical protein
MENNPLFLQADSGVARMIPATRHGLVQGGMLI